MLKFGIIDTIIIPNMKPNPKSLKIAIVKFQTKEAASLALEE